MGDWYSGNASFVIEGWFAESDEEAQAAVNKLRDELVDWINTKKESELVISHIEVNLDPQNIETP